MRARSCPWEEAVLAAAAVSPSGAGWSDQLRAHAAACAVCRGAHLLMQAMHDARDAAAREAVLPSAGQVWWRAAVRLRLDAARQALRPIAWLQGLAGATAAGLTVALADDAWPALHDGADLVLLHASRLLLPAPHVGSLLEAAARQTLPLAPLLLAAACVCLAPLALYWALRDDEPKGRSR